jgi:hypothetical protein
MASGRATLQGMDAATAIEHGPTILLGVKRAVRLGEEFRTGRKVEDPALDDRYELALRLLGVLLYELRENLEFARRHGGGAWTYGTMYFGVSDGVLAELCRVAPHPPLVEACRKIIAALKRVDFYLRLAPTLSADRADKDLSPREEAYRTGAGFAWHAVQVDKDNLITLFNDLVKYGNVLAADVYKAPDWADGGMRLFPAVIDPESPFI